MKVRISEDAGYVLTSWEADSFSKGCCDLQLKVVKLSCSFRWYSEKGNEINITYRSWVGSIGNQSKGAPQIQVTRGWRQRLEVYLILKFLENSSSCYGSIYDFRECRKENEYNWLQKKKKTSFIINMFNYKRFKTHELISRGDWCLLGCDIVSLGK